MRISFVLASLWLSGGEQIILELANRLNQKGHRVTLIVPEGTQDPEMLKLVQPGIQLVSTKPSGARKMSLASMVQLGLALAAAIPPSDVIITTFTPTTPAGWIASRILRRGRLAWFYQDFPEMFENRPLYRWLARKAARHNDCILTISQSLVDDLKPYAGKTPIYKIGEALSLPEIYHPYPLEDQIRPSEGRRALLYLGDQRPRKGLSDFLAASELVYARHPEIELWLVLKDADSVASDIPHKVIQRPTNVEKARLYASCNVYVSSTRREGFGLPPLEAMACGAAVVMTDSGGGREYARNEENCLLVPPNAPFQLAEAIVRVLEDPELESKLRRNGPPAAASFNWETVLERCELALQRVIGQ